jgi:hypothetical protein
MIEYIYFVKCPNCEDEHFSFFNEAKEFALGCLSQKPIITQVEVNRNDFGECTDSCDLGTVWSWEDMMKDTEEPEQTTFTKDNLRCADCGHDPEFDTLDNSVEFDVRKPIPEGMTIEQLVEEMEENEDEVECALCNELFPKTECYYDEDEGYICPDCKEETVKCTWCGMYYDPSELRKEVDLGWLCDRCEAAIKSRGETLTFIEGNSWDLLDEGIIPPEAFANCVDFSDFEIWGVKKLDEVTYKANLLKRYEKVDLKDSDAEQEVYDEMYRIKGLFTFSFGKDGKPILDAWNRALLDNLGNCEIIFDDANYDVAVDSVFNKKHLHETFDANEKVDFEYTDLEVTLQGAKRDVDDWDEKDVKVDYTYSVDKNTVATDIWENFITEEDVVDVPGGLEVLEDDAAWEKFLETHFDELVEKYYTQLLDFYRERAVTAYEERSLEDYYDDFAWDRADSAVNDILVDRFSEACSSKKSMLEELEDSEAYSARLASCPECGMDNAFDHETGMCIKCGFII